LALVNVAAQVAAVLVDCRLPRINARAPDLDVLDAI